MSDAAPLVLARRRLQDLRHRRGGGAGAARHRPRGRGAASWSRSPGPSGSGKTTLMEIMGCLSRPSVRPLPAGGPRRSTTSAPTRWRACAASRSASCSRASTCCRGCRRVENVELPLGYRGVARARAARARARRARRASASRSAPTHRPAELSGGERQRVAVARALVNAPAPGAGRRADRQPRLEDRRRDPAPARRRARRRAPAS